MFIADAPKDATDKPTMPAADAAPVVKMGTLEKARALVGAFKPVYWQALMVVAVLYFARCADAWKRAGVSVPCH